LFLEAVPDGWWYSAPLPDGRMVAAYLTDHDLLPPGQPPEAVWAQRLRQSRLTGERLREAGAPRSVRVVAAHAQWAGGVAGPGWLAIGDAALAHDPLSGMGIGWGLASPWYAARALAVADPRDPGPVRRYLKWAQAACRNYLEQQARYYGRVVRWTTNPYWARRAGP
jgi:flavin-dependent dehydrogenase